MTNITLDWVTLAQILRESIFLAVLLMGWKKVWVFGWVYLDKVRECNAWRRMALRGTTFLEFAADIEGKVKKDESDE